MKKFYLVLVAAFALLSINACDKQEISYIDSDLDGTFIFNSSRPSIDEGIETRTGWTGSSVQWLKNDNIRVAFKVDNEWQGKEGEETVRLYASKALTENTDIASFIVPTDFNKDYSSLSESEFEFFGLYPTKAVSSTTVSNPPSVTITIPSTQAPKEDTFDPYADFLVGKTEIVKGMPTEALLMSWNRIVALGQITLKNLSIPEGEALQTVSFTAQENADLVGSYTLDLVEGTVSTPKGETNVVTIDAANLKIASDNSLKVWIGILPATITSLKVVVETDKALYTRDFSNITRTFVKNKRNILGINMAEAIRQEKEIEPQNYPYLATLASIGDFTIKNIKIPDNLSFVWKIDTENKYAKASAYVSSIAYETEALLISPFIDMTGSENPELSFDHTSKYFNDISSETSVLVRIQGEDTWTSLTIDKYPSNNDWKFVNAKASLAAYKDNVIQIAFKYTSSSAAAGTWEVKNFKVDEALEEVEGIGFSWISPSSITDGYSITVENGANKTDYYQDKNSTTGLDLLFKKSDGSALFEAAPSSITLTVTVGGGSVKDPLVNSVYGSLVDSDGNNIDASTITVTNKVEKTTGTEYTVNVPIVPKAYGLRISHVKESGYNIRIYKVTFSAE